MDWKWCLWKGAQKGEPACKKPHSRVASHTGQFWKNHTSKGEDLDLYSFKTESAHVQKFLYTPQFEDKQAQQSITQQTILIIMWNETKANQEKKN